MRSQLITCLGRLDYVVYVSVMRMRIASDIGDRRPRDLYRGWSQLGQELLHGCD